ncbi:hypothetical protein GIY09_11150 [Aerococcaceae bacterium WS4759]|uniref:Beta-carotene 15,15'-monooxygenase n=1 Tax=Fundicoccus ignavus TaxID=2664442 RepID=A0A6I2GLF6_9LACT|nr:hypothetical protein [Fundicoccus ignavus]MRI86401.1 hypothetical protein [Fundicoccus ignavus]
MEITKKPMRIVPILSIIVAFAVMLFSWWFLESPIMVNLTEYVTAELDAMREIVVQLTAISTISSTALTLLPGDVAAPLAENLADISDYLLIVFAALWLQKYLFSSMGIIVLKYLIPAGMSLIIAAGVLDLFNLSPNLSDKIRYFGKRIAFFGTIVFLVVPTTVFITSQIEDTYQTTINQTIEQANQVQTELSDEAVEQDANQEETTNDNFLGQVSDFVTDGVDSVVDFTTGAIEQVTSVVSDLPDKFMITLNNLIDSVAVLIVVNCIAPLLVFSFLIWVVKMIFQLDLSPSPNASPKFRPIGSAVRKRTLSLKKK